jgi:hypothetical protein
LPSRSRLAVHSLAALELLKFNKEKHDF